MSTRERTDYVSSNIKSKNGTELGNFVYHLQLSKIDLKPFNNILLEKLNNAVFPYDTFILSEILIEDKNNIPLVENALRSKIKIWDTGNWSEKFWALIKNYNLNIEKPKDYGFEDKYTKKYNIPKFIENKLNNDEIGENPLLIINWNFVNYEKGKLIETLNDLNIKQIDITPKSKSVSLYGSKGIDGLLNILTN